MESRKHNTPVLGDFSLLAFIYVAGLVNNVFKMLNLIAVTKSSPKSSRKLCRALCSLNIIPGRGGKRSKTKMSMAYDW